MSESITSAAVTIMSALSPRIQRRTGRRHAIDVATQLVAASRRYRGGTAAEQDAHRELRGRLKSQMRAEYFAGVGRRIDLIAMLGLQRNGPGSDPVWRVIDPRMPLEPGNDGRLRMDGPRLSHVAWLPLNGQYCHAIEVAGRAAIPVSREYKNGDYYAHQSTAVIGIPAIPPRVRRLLTRPEMRQASMVSLLFEPSEWQLARPADPAIVVEWRDRPGEYYALAVWGADMPRIMEFVD